MDAAPKIEVPVGDPEVIRILEEALSEARAGRMIGVGLVKIPGPGGLTVTAAGGPRTDIYTGCGMLQAKLLEVMGGGGGRSRLLRPM